MHLSSKYTTKRAIVLSTYLLDNVIHRPTIEVFVGDNLQRKTIDFSISFDCLQRVIPVASNPLINRQQEEVKSIAVLNTLCQMKDVGIVTCGADSAERACEQGQLNP